MTPVLVLLIASLGQAAEVPDAAVEKGRQDRLQHMTARLETVQIETVGEQPRTLKRMEAPVLRYTNPVRSSRASGATFLWLEGQRPMVAASISIRDNNSVVWEFTSLTGEKLKATRDETVFWTPNAAGRPAELLPDAPPPAQSPALRLAQLRTLARRFEVAVERGTWQRNRLLSQPLHRWAMPESGILEGALFCFTETTDPEVLLLIEARRDETTQKHDWYFTIAKMTGPPAKVELDQKPLWHSGGGYWSNPRNPTDSYMEAVIGTYPPEAK